MALMRTFFAWLDPPIVRKGRCLSSLFQLSIQNTSTVCNRQVSVGIVWSAPSPTALLRNQSETIKLSMVKECGSLRAKNMANKSVCKVDAKLSILSIFSTLASLGWVTMVAQSTLPAQNSCVLLLSYSFLGHYTFHFPVIWPSKWTYH